MRREEALRVTGRLKLSHVALSLPGDLMGHLRSVVRVLRSVVHHRWDFTVDIDVDGYRSSFADSHFQNADGVSTRMPLKGSRTNRS